MFFCICCFALNTDIFYIVTGMILTQKRCFVNKEKTFLTDLRGIRKHRFGSARAHTRHEPADGNVVNLRKSRHIYSLKIAATVARTCATPAVLNGVAEG